MGRPRRTTSGGLVYHVLNRANARMPIFDTPGDYEAFERIIEEAVERVQMRLLSYSSEALQYETEQNFWPVRREHAKAVLAKAKSTAVVSESVQQRAGQIAESGIKPLDALHLALAEAAGAECFCTCDDQLLQRGKRIQNLKLRILSPLDLVQEIEA